MTPTEQAAYNAYLQQNRMMNYGDAQRRAFLAGIRAAFSKPVWDAMTPDERDWERGFGSASKFFPLMVTGWCDSCNADMIAAEGGERCHWCNTALHHIGDPTPMADFTVDPWRAAS